MNATATNRPTARARRSSRLLALALGLPFVGVSAAQATTTIEGSAVQLNSQASTMTQQALNIATPLPVIGVNGSKGTQTGTSALSDSEHIPLGAHGVAQGTTTQGSTQGAATAQTESGSKTEANTATGTLGNDQLLGGGTGGIVLGDTGQSNRQGNTIGQSIAGSKTANAGLGSNLRNNQIVGDATGIVIGSSSQDNAQADATGQSVAQKEGNPKLGNSALVLNVNTTSGEQNTQGVLATTIIGTALQGGNQGHSGTQVTSQAPAALITGSFTPTSTDGNTVTVGNCQVINDGSPSCLID